MSAQAVEQNKFRSYNWTLLGGMEQRSINNHLGLYFPITVMEKEYLHTHGLADFLIRTVLDIEFRDLVMTPKRPLKGISFPRKPGKFSAAGIHEC